MRIFNRFNEWLDDILYGWDQQQDIKDVVIADLRARLVESEERWDAAHSLANHNFSVANRIERELKDCRKRARNEVRDEILSGKIDILAAIRSESNHGE